MLIVSANDVAGAASATTPSVAAAKESVAFVSLVPGTVPRGVSATIENRAKQQAVTAPVIDGGFDPVAIVANVGDNIDVTVTDVSNLVVFHATATVKAPHRPVVVRTSPPTRKSDIPLNSIIVVVFSAPIDPATLTAESIQLLRNGSAVEGALAFSDSTNIKAEFQPNDALEGETDYQLLITPAIRDMNGMALKWAVDVRFRTARAPIPAKLVFVAQPQNTTAGEVMSAVTVGIFDNSGNIITSPTYPVTILLTNAANSQMKASGTSTVNSVNGVATFDDLLIASALDSYNLTAYLSDHANPTTLRVVSSPFSILPAAASKLALFGAAVAETDRPYEALVVVRDAFDNVVANTSSITLSLSANPTGAQLSGTLTAPAIGGSVRFANLSIDKPGLGYELQATSGTLTSATMGIDVWNSGAFSAVTAGGSHTCSVTRHGFAYCWGANASGQVGDGTTSDRASPVIVASGMSAIAAGGGHTCGVANTALYCWGLNEDGQLGDGTKLNRASPTPNHTFGAEGLTTGGSFTCTLYVVPDPWDFGGWYQSRCWGSNAQGQLLDASVWPDYAVLASGGAHSCGVHQNAPSLYCWGSNTNGQLGVGSTTSSAAPVLVAGLSGSSQVSAGRAHTCASVVVASASTLYCWGLNDNGQLGDGTTSQRASPVLVSGGFSLHKITAGGSHTCALTSAGVAYCWGANENGQLGDGTTTMRTSPVPVAGGLTFVSLTAGGSHTCGVTVEATYCWGANGNGQLGNGTTTDSNVPVKVSGQP